MCVICDDSEGRTVADTELLLTEGVATGAVVWLLALVWLLTLVWLLAVTS
jgi:hypothetical protein